MVDNHIHNEPLEQWWTQTLAGDSHAFHHIHRVLFDGLYGYAHKILQDPTLAGDAVQELFVRLWMRRESIGPIRNLKPYFFTVLRRQILNQLRDRAQREKRMSALPEPTIAFSPEEIVMRQEEYAHLQEKISSLLNGLPERQREVIYLHYFENMEYAQIAEVMGINYQSVLNLTHKALQRLRAANLLSAFLIFLKFL